VARLAEKITAEFHLPQAVHRELAGVRQPFLVTCPLKEVEQRKAIAGGSMAQLQRSRSRPILSD
jgi:hypothetical protein